jgi:hypothetical protein
VDQEVNSVQREVASCVNEMKGILSGQVGDTRRSVRCLVDLKLKEPWRFTVFGKTEL